MRLLKNTSKIGQFLLLVLLTIVFLGDLNHAGAQGPVLTVKISFQYDWIYEGESVNAEVVVSNTGEGTAHNVIVKLINLPSGFSADKLEKNIGDISSKSTEKAYFKLSTDFSTPTGSYEIRVQVSYNGETTSGIEKLEVKSTPLKIADFKPSPTKVSKDREEEIAIITKIDNIGTITLHDIEILLDVDPMAFTIIDGEKYYPEIGTGGSTGEIRLVIKSKSGSTHGDHYFKLIVEYTDPDGRPHEFSKLGSIYFREWYEICIIATATYGSELSPQVQFLRTFRDRTVMSTFAGSQFMIIFNKWYYSFSPYVAIFIAKNEIIRSAMKVALYPLIGILHLASMTYSAVSFNPEFGITMAGIVAGALIGVVYFSPWITVLIMLPKRFRKTALKVNRLKLIAFMWLGSIALLFLGETLFSSPIMMVATACLALTTISLSAMIAAIKTRSFIEEYSPSN